MTTATAFYAAINAQPEDSQLRLVAGDWFEENHAPEIAELVKRPIPHGTSPAEYIRPDHTRAYRLLSRTVRECLDIFTYCPIQAEDGFSPPRLVGKKHHYTNKSGDVIYHPNAYRKAWGKPIYVGSTRRIVVGRGWLIQQGLV